MTTYRNIYPKKFIDGAMLDGHGAQPVAIEAVTVEEFYDPFSKRKTQKIVLAFHKKTARLPLNQTQAEALATIAKTDDYEQWIGHSIRLSATLAPNRKLTVAILPPLVQDAPAAQPHPDPDPDLPIDPDAEEEEEEGAEAGPPEGAVGEVSEDDLNKLFDD